MNPADKSFEHLKEGYEMGVPKPILELAVYNFGKDYFGSFWRFIIAMLAIRKDDFVGRLLDKLPFSWSPKSYQQFLRDTHE